MLNLSSGLRFEALGVGHMPLFGSYHVRNGDSGTGEIDAHSGNSIQKMEAIMTLELHHRETVIENAVVSPSGIGKRFFLTIFASPTPWRVTTENAETPITIQTDHTDHYGQCVRIGQ